VDDLEAQSGLENTDSLETLDGFLNALDNSVEGAALLVGDAQAFLDAMKSIESLLTQNWPVLEASLKQSELTPEDRQRLLRLLEAITTLETKTHARLVWSEDFEAHMRRAMESVAQQKA
jgi:hypothetical protein